MNKNSGGEKEKRKESSEVDEGQPKRIKKIGDNGQQDNRTRSERGKQRSVFAWFCSITMFITEEEQQPEEQKEEKSSTCSCFDTCDLCLGTSQAKANQFFSSAFPFASEVCISDQRRQTHLVTEEWVGCC